MAALATYLAALSDRADDLLEKHHQQLFDLGLDVSFNRATLATKYWLPLPERDEPTAVHEEGDPHGESDEQLFSALRECERILKWFETAVKLKLNRIVPHATSAFAQSARKISRMIDARRQSSDFDSDSDSSNPGSTALHTKDAGKAGSQPQSHGPISPRSFVGDELPDPSTTPAKSAQNLTSNTQTYTSTEFDIQNRPQSPEGDEDDVSSSLRGSQTQWYPPKPQKDDPIQSPYSLSLDYPMSSDISSPAPSQVFTSPGGYLAAQDHHVYASRESATSSAARPPPTKALPAMSDHTTDQLDPEGKEYIPREIDPIGETKVSKDGRPLEGRVFRCRTFQLPDRGETLFMLGRDCACVLGYHSPSLMFDENRSLFKIILSRTEKVDLRQREIILYLFLSIEIAVVTARSMFRQFGARLVKDGRRVKDDYWEAKAREQGFTEEDAADEERPGAARARKAMAAGASSFASKDSLGNLKDWDVNTRQQGFTEEDTAGSPGNRHDKTLVDTARDPHKASDARPGLGQEPPESVPADSSVPTSSTSFAATRSSDPSVRLIDYWRRLRESPK